MNPNKVQSLIKVSKNNAGINTNKLVGEENKTEKFKERLLKVIQINKIIFELECDKCMRKRLFNWFNYRPEYKPACENKFRFYK